MVRGANADFTPRLIKERVRIMGTEHILKNLEQTITRVCKDIKKKKGAVGADKLNSVSKLANAYNRLLEKNKAQPEKQYQDDPEDYIMK